jgi:cysteine desulfurase
MGVGALLLRSGEQRLAPWLLGGDQERGLRAGTQALPLIAGLAAACRSRASAFAADIAQMVRLRDRFETQIRSTLPSIRVNGATTSRLPNTSNLMFPGIDAMAMLALLDDAGILASQGSACHSRRPEPSPVLMAMGLSEDEAFASMRFSMSPLNTEAEIDAAVASVSQKCQRLGLQS